MAKFYKNSRSALNPWLFLLLGLGLMQTGCLMTRNEANERKVTVQDQVQTLQKTNADQATRFADIDSDMRAMTGRIEVLENRVAQYQAQSQDNVKAQDLERKITLLQEEITRLNTVMENLNAEMAGLKAGASAKIPDPTGKKGAFEIAEEYFGKKEWKKAVLAYQKFRDENPKSKRFPTATLRIGQSFQELGMKDDAKTFFDEVIAKYPSSSEAKQAKTLLKKK